VSRVLFKKSKNETRLLRHRRVRKKIQGNVERPRLNVYRSLNHIYVQVIDDTSGQTLVAASTLDAELKEKLKSGGNKEAAKAVGELAARKCLDKGIDNVVFDRGGYLYHGRIKALADGAREAGLKF
jgi:large subunit ribosomal protein L18